MDNIKQYIEEQIIDFGEGFMLVINAVDDVGKAVLYLASIPYNKLYNLERCSSIEVEKNDNPNPETRLRSTER